MVNRLPLFMLACLPFSSTAQPSDSVIMTCHKTSENHVQVTACLDNHWQLAQKQLDKTVTLLNAHFTKLDEISSISSAVKSAEFMVTRFNVWREAQCKMVEASYASGSGSGQGYLSCMIELTQEQVGRLNDVMGIKENAQ
ncbi:lysozyme inhibitor LprI family protein [Enterovibrio calviensis]|uniref:lysozyme inhibitor LprI family protein n=1 Tax=Enterovibrio calviensis TaxID=91359 RepID=UPI001FE01793|nr:lysozyme inhibitor LprI family protein [Enterovibrio calviensis]